MDSVTVIGASVAGLFAAGHLARCGVPVRVYEAQAPFRPAPRTLIVTPTFLRLADFDTSEAILNRVRTFELFSRSAAARISLAEPDLVLERARLLHLLARQAQGAGAEIVHGHRLQALHNHRAVPLLQFSTPERERRLLAPRVLGADGAHSVTASGIEQQGLEQVALLQVRVALPADQPPDTVRVWFDRAATRFFVWLIPESPHTAAAGLIADTLEQAEAALAAFLTAQDLEPLERQEDAWVPLPPLAWRTTAPLADGRVLLVGDAAGQVKASTVGGVVSGMRGALAAVRSLVRGTPYPRELAPLCRELNLHTLVRLVLDGFTDEDYDHLLRALNRPALRLLSRHDRDGLARTFWRLVLAQPRWLPLGARALLRALRETRTLYPPAG